MRGRDVPAPNPCTESRPPPIGPGERFGEQAVLDARYGAFDFG